MQEELLWTVTCKHAYTARAALAQPCLLAERKTYPTYPHQTAGASLVLAILAIKKAGHCTTFFCPGAANEACAC